MQAVLFENDRTTYTREEKLLAIAERMGYYITLLPGCVEPGYDDKPVALADWNSKSRWDARLGKHVDSDWTMPRLAKLFEKLGYAVEWEDEWASCECCGKAVRTQADSYSWKPYYSYADSFGFMCGDCIKDDPETLLFGLSGTWENCLTIPLDLEKYGYTLYEGGYENGWHPGQNDNPETIAKRLQSDGIDDFIFVLDHTGQFDIGFSVWVKQVAHPG